MHIWLVKAVPNQNVPLPSHFNTTEFTISAIDNFNHTDAATLSSKNDHHDSVMVLFQNINQSSFTTPTSKGKVSNLNFVAHGRKYNKEMECQKLSPFYLKSKKAPHADFISRSFSHEECVSQKKILQISRSK